MNISKMSFFLYASFLLLSLTGCSRGAHDVWDDTRTAGRHVGRGLRSLGGKHGDSREIHSRDDFYHHEGMPFEPLPDQEYSPDISMSEAQARMEPGTPTSKIPGIESFKDPSLDPKLNSSFKPILFAYNSNLIKDESEIAKIRKTASYLKKHPETYLFIEGHCDERGPEAYNLALGSRRSNAVRSFLIKEGISPEKIFTVSYGKERPIDSRHNEEAWRKNRRAQFRIYEE